MALDEFSIHGMKNRKQDGVTCESSLQSDVATVQITRLSDIEAAVSDVALVVLEAEVVLFFPSE